MGSLNDTLVPPIQPVTETERASAPLRLLSNSTWVPVPLGRVKLIFRPRLLATDTRLSMPTPVPLSPSASTGLP